MFMRVLGSLQLEYSPREDATMPLEQKPITEPFRSSPYAVPPDHQGWRGLGLTGVSAKRRSYTLFWNEQVLVCGLLLIPGERSIRHSHETGELSITFSDSLHPTVSYNPPGMLHGGAPPPAGSGPDAAMLAEAVKSAGMPALDQLVERLLEEQRHLRQQLEELKSPAGPRMLIDITFPPFKTTIDDPLYAEKRTVIGPWYD
jgi:hypothetical protein